MVKRGYTVSKYKFKLTKSNIEATILGSGTEPGWHPWRRNLNLTIPARKASISTGFVSNSCTTISIGSDCSDGVPSGVFLDIGKMSSSFFLLADLVLRCFRFAVEVCSVVDSESKRSSTLPNGVPTVFCFLHVPRVKICSYRTSHR